MTTASVEYPNVLHLSEQESEIARESSRQLVRLLGIQKSHGAREDQTLSVEFKIDHEGEHEVVALPIAALGMLSQILMHMANGETVLLMPQDYELTTQQAADMLNVSRPFVIGLMEKGELPFHKVGTHRRVCLDRVMRLKQEYSARSSKALDELAALSQEYDMGY